MSGVMAPATSPDMTCKTASPYYATYSRHSNAIINTYDLASTYTLPFRTAVTDGNALGVMCSCSSFPMP